MDEHLNVDASGRRRGTRRNLTMICLAYTCAFTSFDAVTNLQSSINATENVGLNALAIFYGVSAFACLFLTTPLIHILGYKWSIVGGQIGMIGYIAASMYPKLWLLFPVSALSGILHACMATAQDSYIVVLAHDNSKNEQNNAKVTKYYSIFLTVYQSTQIWGNLASYLVFRGTPQSQTNLTQCGANFDPNIDHSEETTDPVSSKTMYILLGILIGIVTVSLFFTVGLLSQRRRMCTDQSTGVLRQSLAYTRSTVKLLVKPKHLILFPLGFWSVAPEAFIIGTFTNSFITCAIGLPYVGLVMTVYGITAFISSFAVIYVTKFKYSRFVCFLLAALMSYATFIAMLLWKPTVSQTYVLFILPCLSNIADSITEPFLTALYDSMLPDSKEDTYSLLILVQSVGFLIVYLYSTVLTTRVSIILQIIYLTVAMVCYAVIELLLSKSSGRNTKKEIDLDNMTRSFFDNPAADLS